MWNWITGRKSSTTDGNICPCAAWCEKGEKAQPLHYSKLCQEKIMEYRPEILSEVTLSKEISFHFTRYQNMENISAKDRRQLEVLYPNLNVRGVTPHETSRHRNGTSHPLVIEQCWKGNGNVVNDPRLKEFYLKYFNVKNIPSTVVKFLDKYKLDLFGNVISKTTNKNALTGFDIDHLYPWSRGGLSNIHNFICCQNVANRFIKGDKLLPCLTTEVMACGLHFEQLLGIVNFCILQSSEHRNTLSHLLTKFEKFLESDPPSKTKKIDDMTNSWIDFQKETQGSTDGAFLFAYFRYIEDKQLYALGLLEKSRVGSRPLPFRPNTFRGQHHLPFIVNPDPSRLPTPHTLFQPASNSQYTLFLSHNVLEERIEVSGHVSDQLSKVLMQEFDMAWDEKRGCWWYFVEYFLKDDIEGFLYGLKEYLERLSVTVKLEGDEEELIGEMMQTHADEILFIPMAVAVPVVVDSAVTEEKPVPMTPTNPSSLIQPGVCTSGARKGAICKDCVKLIEKGKTLCWRHDPDRKKKEL